MPRKKAVRKRKHSAAPPSMEDHLVYPGSPPGDVDVVSRPELVDIETLVSSPELEKDFPCTFYCDLLCCLPEIVVKSWSEEKRRKVAEELTKCHDECGKIGKISLGCSIDDTVIGESGEDVWIDIRGRYIKDAIGVFISHLFNILKFPKIKRLNVIVGCNLHGVGNGILKQAVMHILDRDKSILNDPEDNVIAIEVTGKNDFKSLLIKPAPE